MALPTGSVIPNADIELSDVSTGQEFAVSTGGPSFANGKATATWTVENPVPAGERIELQIPDVTNANTGATVGVSAVGGTQDAAARWLAAKGGLNPKTDIKVAQIGNPVALQAALENKQIDAFVLSPPEGFLAEKSGSGVILASLGDDFPVLNHQPYLVLAAKKPIDRWSWS